MQECFLVLAVCLTGVCGLLLLGTRYFPFATLPLVAGLGIWAALRRYSAEVPDDYTVAQRVDSHEALSDALSTAYHFRTAGIGTRSADVAAAQYESAAKSAAEIQPQRVFPRTVPPTQRASLLLLASAVLFFSLRIGVQPQVSFEPPLASLLLSTLFGYQPEPNAPAPQQIASMDPGPDALPELGEDDLLLRPQADLEPDHVVLPEEESDEAAGTPSEMPEVEGLITLPLEEQAPDGMLQDVAVDSDQIGEGSQEGDMPPDPGGDDWGEEEQGLLDKLKQAFENMLRTLDMASTETADSESGQEQGSGSTEEAASEGNSADSGDAEQDPSSQTADASMEGGELGSEAGETASAGSTSGEDSSGDQSSGENASAAGTSDGDKELAEAQQMEVLGALEELYMERAKNMTGEVTIETRLAEQSASVPYNQRSTSHADGGGAVTRDEIPGPYRTYIQNYFDTLRRNSE